MKPDDMKAFIQMITDAETGAGDASDFQKLEQQMLNCQDSRRNYLRFIQMRTQLEASPPEVHESELDEAISGRIQFFRNPYVMTAVGLAAAFMIGFVSWLSSTGFTGLREGEGSVATVLFSEDCVWRAPDNGLVEGQALSAGKIALAEGIAVIRFDGGAELMLVGKSSVELVSADAAKVFSGEVVVRAENGAEGFRVDTPEGEVIDLGTEFSIRVDQTGSTELEVYEGKVATRDITVGAGETVALKRGAPSIPAVRGKSYPRFDEWIRKAAPKERRDLMTAYEGFFVPEGIYPPEELGSGKGWAGPWRLRTEAELGGHAVDTEPNMLIGHAQMTVPWPVRGGRQGMLELPAGMNIRTRQMQHPIEMSKSGITYFSFLAAERIQAESTEQSKREAFRVTFRSSEDYYGERLSVGWNQQRVLMLSSGSGRTNRSIRKVPSEETVFCVGKITRSKRDRDQIRLRFYRKSDLLDFAEPAEWDVYLEDDELDASLDLLLITSQGNTSRFVDEIRIGPTWRSVTPIATPELPSS